MRLRLVLAGFAAVLATALQAAEKLSADDAALLLGPYAAQAMNREPKKADVPTPQLGKPQTYQMLPLPIVTVSQEAAPKKAPDEVKVDVKTEVKVEVISNVDVVAEKPVVKTVEVISEKEITNTVEKVVEVPVVVEKPVTNTVEKIVEKPVVVEKAVTNTVEKIVEKPVVVEKAVTNTVEKIVEKAVTNTVEKLVFDRTAEQRLEKDVKNLEAKQSELEDRNAKLEEELKAERKRRAELENAAKRGSGTAAVAKPNAKDKQRPVRITSTNTHYDRKKGLVYFEGKVFVDDVSYQLHADKAYVFTTGTNDVRRIVAIGNVALTNDAKRAYGDKVSYYRKDGMVVLYADKGHVAEVRDESKEQDQTVRGSKIKFWINSQQVEVFNAEISAPTSGAGDLKSLGGF